MKAEQLKMVRAALNLTQSHLAKESGMTQTQIANIENGYVKTWAKYEYRIISALETKRLDLMEDLEYKKSMLQRLF